MAIQIQHLWAHIAARQIGFRRSPERREYAVNMVYVEFENVAAPEDPVAVPDDDPAVQIEYYSALLDVPGRDFLRFPLRFAPELTATGENADAFPEGFGNTLRFTVDTEGNSGVHGREFSSAANSKVCGAALVAAPDPDDRSQDVVFARWYFQPDKQVLKTATAPVRLSAPVVFASPGG